MRSRLLAAAIAGACITVLPVAAAASASADTTTVVTPDQCYAAGGGFGGYNADDQPYCAEGGDNGDVLSYDPLQGWCPAGEHIVIVYLQGLACAPDVPNT